MRCVVLIVLAGCTFRPAGTGGDDDVPRDDGGLVIADAISADARCDFALVDLCDHTPTIGDMTISGAETLDTDGDVRCAPLAQGTGAPELCLIHAGSITITATGQLTAIGSRPLVLAAAGPLVVDGLIDVSSYRGRKPGAGAGSGGCPAGQPPESDLGGAAGAAGGSFGGAGGAGGLGDTDNSLGLDGTAAAGTPGAVAALPTVVRGGCGGGEGGDESGAAGAGQGGEGGEGGGGVLLVAGTIVRIGATGVVRATGAGAAGGTVQAGGGGGGSGGLVALVAAQLEVAGALAANGGGGGGGGARVNGNPVTGGAGADGAVGITPASGGTPAHDAAGGAGAAGSTAATAGGPSVVGAGGGGGGAGFVVLRGPATVTGVVSPPPSP